MSDNINKLPSFVEANKATGGTAKTEVTNKVKDEPMMDGAPAADSATSPAPISQAATPTPVPIPVLPTARSSTPATAAAAASPSNPARTGTTPMRNGGEAMAVAGGGSGSRSASVLPESAASMGMPAEAALHGAPVRQYLNTNVTLALLEGMKKIAKERPTDPLRTLGEFLIQQASQRQLSEAAASAPATKTTSGST